MADTAGIPTRRTVVAAAGAAGLVATLAACGDGSNDSSKDAGSPGASGGDQSQSSGGDTGGDTGGGTGGKDLGSAADIPVGGGKVIDKKVVVTQPTKGDFRAFSAICTHQGCPVSAVEGGTINCPCHGSKYSIEDGSVKGGPAPKPLSKLNVKVEGGSIKLA
jgi:Rieske Fe-S protein